MSLSVHILKKGVVFPPAPREIRKWGQKHSSCHDDWGVTSSAGLSGGRLGSVAHSYT